jgi:hypothetical protein
MQKFFQVVGMVTTAAAAMAVGAAVFADEKPTEPVVKSTVAKPAMPAKRVNDIRSDADGALATPDQWNCDYLVEEYRAWLDAGNRPESWRYAGHSYLDINSKAQYSWDNWIDWQNEAGCLPVALAKPELLPAAIGGSQGVGAVLGVFGAGVATAIEGENADSPG